MRLDGKGFVTGARRGIGKCTATDGRGRMMAIVETLTSKILKKTAKELAEKTEERLSQSRQTVQTKSRLMQAETGC